MEMAQFLFLGEQWINVRKITTVTFCADPKSSKQCCIVHFGAVATKVQLNAGDSEKLVEYLKENSVYYQAPAQSRCRVAGGTATCATGSTAVKQAQFLGLALTAVKDDCALPTSFLIVVEFTEVSNYALPRSRVGPQTLDEREVDVRLTVFGSAVASEKHPCLQTPAWRRGPRDGKRVGFHYNAKTAFPLRKHGGFAGNSLENRRYFQ
jgi:hypothetical protein